MDILGKALGKARKLETTLARTLDRAAQQWSQSGPRGPLEVLQAIVEAVEDKLEPAGRGTHVLPFNKIKVTVAAASRDDRARFSGVFDGDPTLQQRIITHLRKAGCNVPGLIVKIAYAPQPDPAWATPEFHIEFFRAAASELPAAEDATAREITLTVVSGTADKPAYALTQDRINLGRCAEVRDSRNHLLRTNHVVFTDGGGGANNTVSRRHAHIDYDERAKDYRISDDRSASGTTIVRNGRTIVAPASSRGLRLQSGDEIVLGQARLKITIADA